ncbi:MAG: FAD-linked oxidase C-terminal domain-containing protein [Planctomycetota bacterium]
MVRLNVLEGLSKEESARAGHARWLHERLRGQVRFGRHDRMLWSTDASIFQVEPYGVVVPADASDALEAVRLTRERGLAILPRGGGTSLGGQCVGEGVVIDFSAGCRAIRSVDPGGRRCWADAGASIGDVNAAVAEHGLFFAPDPSTWRHANVGGCVGNNAAGTRSVRYGRTSENLHGLDVVLADGTRLTLDEGAASRSPIALRLTAKIVEICRRHESLIRERFPKTVRRNAGYGLDMILAQLDAAERDGVGVMDRVNLAPLLCGSEGTLAVTLGAELKLHALPRAKGLAVIGFNALAPAIEAVGPILDPGGRSAGPVAVELLDDLVVGLAKRNVEYRRYVELMPQPRSGELEAVLYIEYFAPEDADDPEAWIEESFGELRERAARLDLSAGVWATRDPGEMASLLKLRSSGEPLLHGIPGNRKPLGFVEDNAVPVESLPEFVREFQEILSRHGTRGSFYAHASVGVLHVRPLLDLRDGADRERMEEIAVEVADLAQRLGGVMSGEHGDGRIRGPLLERYFGPELMAAFGEVKRVFDPENRLNPGNIVEPGPIASIHENTRVQPAAAKEPVEIAGPEVETYFDYADQHGFMGAVEMCNGAGVCRKKSGGVMCPSYMASLDERHATRGRGNALRLAITGQLAANRPGSASGRPEWGDPETEATLNLCLSCKACKSECPSNVDIARLKAEYTAQTFRDRGGVPLKNRVFANVRLLNRLGSIAPGLANFANRTPLAKWALRTLLGIDPRRDVPSFENKLRFEPSSQDDRPCVAVFADCFSTFNETEIGRATERVLGAFGYRVVLADAGCCARPHISTGVLDSAIATADATLARLDAIATDHAADAIIVLEPSCLSAITDDWRQLKLRSDKDTVERFASKSFLLEDFLERRWDEHPERPVFDADRAGGVLFHGHCHQKAMWGVESSSKLLTRLLGDRLDVADTTCCGMAGSFGYTTDRYDFSMSVGEVSVFPAVRAAEGRAVCAPGTSCRHQIKDGTGREAVHPAVLLASMLAGPQ